MSPRIDPLPTTDPPQTDQAEPVRAQPPSWIGGAGGGRTLSFRCLPGSPEALFVHQDPGATVYLYRELSVPFEDAAAIGASPQHYTYTAAKKPPKRRIAGNAQSPKLESPLKSAGWRGFARAKWKLAAQGPGCLNFIDFVSI